MFWTTSRLSQSARSWYTTSIPSPAASFGPLTLTGSALEQDLARVVSVDAGDAFDERRLAGSVVSDERHDLAVTDLEVDVGERLHRPVRLRDPAELEKWWRLAHQASLTTPMLVEAPSSGASTTPSYDYLQYFLYAPVQTSLRFRKPSVKSRV